MAKEKMVSMRISDQLDRDIEAVREMIQKQRGAGANEVSRTEAVQILIKAGADQLLQRKEDSPQRKKTE